MGKKSKRKPKVVRADQAAANQFEGSSAYSDALLPHLSIDELKILSQVSNHIWKVIVCEETLMVIGVVDMTNQVYGGATNPRDMIIRRINTSDGYDQTVNLILNGMKAPPGPGSDDPDFYCPRRPRFLLVDPKLQSIFPGIKDQIELLSIPVRLNSEISYTEAALTVEQSATPHQSSYSEGMTSATASIVKQLPQNPDETWRVFLYNHELSPTGILLVIENHTDITNKTLVGSGATYLLTVGQGILATMLSPVVGPAGGAGDTVMDTPRRPGKVILNTPLDRSISHISEVLLGSGVEVVV